MKNFWRVSDRMMWIKIRHMFMITMIICCSYNDLLSQTVYNDSILIQEALKNPDNVKRLNLDKQSYPIFFEHISEFKNLEYLDLRGLGLNDVPVEISLLKNLRVLDLGENNISDLPKSFSELKNLTELYLDHEKNLNLKKDIKILSNIPNLRILHLEGNDISFLPKSIGKLSYLEQLYVNDNRLKKLPYVLTDLKNLKFVDVHHNPISHPSELVKKSYGGLKIKF